MKKLSAYRISIVIGLTLGLIIAWTSAMSNELSTKDTSFFMGGEEVDYGCCRITIDGTENCPGSDCSVPWTNCMMNTNYSKRCMVDYCHAKDPLCTGGNRYGVCK